MEEIARVENEAEGVRSDLIDKHPLYLRESDDILLSNQQFSIHFVPVDGLILKFRNSTNAHEWNVTVTSDTVYFVIITLADRYVFEYGLNDLEEEETPARIYVIALEEMIDFDIPLRANRDPVIIATPGITYTVAQYYVFDPLETLDVKWPSHNLNLNDVEDSRYVLTMLEETKLKFTVTSLSYVSVINFSRLTISEFEAIPGSQQLEMLPLNDSWSDDLCNRFTNIVNRQLQAPVIDRSEHFTLQNMTLTRFAIRVGTVITLSMENPSPNILDRSLVVTAGERYILVCNNDDRFIITCAHGIIETEAVVRVIAMDSTPQGFVIPLRPNRRVHGVLVHYKKMIFAMIPSDGAVDYGVIEHFIDELEYLDCRNARVVVQLYREHDLDVGRRLLTGVVMSDRSRTMVVNILPGAEELHEI